MAESPKFSRLLGNRGRGTRWWRQILDRKCTSGRFAHAQYKIRYITLIYGRIAKISASYRKSGSRNTTVTSDFRPEMEIWPFRACAVKNTQYNPYLWRSFRNSRVFRKSGSWNTMVTSDVIPEVDKWPFRACAIKNTQYNPYLWRSLRNSCVL